MKPSFNEIFIKGRNLRLTIPPLEAFFHRWKTLSVEKLIGGTNNGCAGLKEILLCRRPAGLGLARPATGINGSGPQSLFHRWKKQFVLNNENWRPLRNRATCLIKTGHA